MNKYIIRSVIRETHKSQHASRNEFRENTLYESPVDSLQQFTTFLVNEER